MIGITAAVAGVVALVWTGLDPPAVHGEAEAGPARLPEDHVFSLLAVGDTGDRLPWRPFGEGQRSVGRGMAAEDRRAPVDAVLLLGDNFYPDGLQRFELVERLRRNLVGPFCRFASSDGPRWDQVASACSLPEDQRNPVPILAVFGNHDYNSEESPALQRTVVPAYLANWSASRDLVEANELEAGVTLIRVDVEAVKKQSIGDPVRLALDRARGRWRILITHEPLTLREGERPPAGSYKGLVRRAIADAFRAPQLVLSGHDHNLQVAPLGLGRPALQVIAGGGSSRRALRQPPYQQLGFGIATTGFARIDLMGRGDEQGLRVSLFTMPCYPIHFWREPRLVSQWWIDQRGRAGRLYPAKS
ncbi:MAG: metallophosphoesterase [Myxococcota bacterium]